LCILFCRKEKGLFNAAFADAVLKKIEPFAWWEGAFTEQELNWLQQKAKEATQEAQVGGGNGGEVNESIRRSELKLANKDPECAWVFERLVSCCRKFKRGLFWV
jgi:hypothetical protein